MIAKPEPNQTVQSLPADLADVALTDAPEAAAVGKMKPSWWYEKVRAGIAPQPVIRAPRCTRWRRSDVIEFWRKFAEQSANDSSTAALVQARATKASAAAKAKRAATAVA